MKTLTVFLQILMLLVCASFGFAQTQQLNVSRITINKFKNFPATVEIQTTQGLTIKGEGVLNWGATICTPCFSGTLINTQLNLTNVTGTDGSGQFGIGFANGANWIDPNISWTTPYFYPRGRNIRKTTPASMRGTLLLFDAAAPVLTPPLYQAELDLQGTITSELSQLTIVPEIKRKTIEFITININLTPRVQ